MCGEFVVLNIKIDMSLFVHRYLHAYVCTHVSEWPQVS